MRKDTGQQKRTIPFSPGFINRYDCFNRVKKRDAFSNRGQQRRLVALAYCLVAEAEAEPELTELSEAATEHWGDSLVEMPPCTASQRGAIEAKLQSSCGISHRWRSARRSYKRRHPSRKRLV